MIEINWLHVLLAALAGGGWALAWGYRTALGIAKEQPPRPPSRSDSKTVDFSGFGERRSTQ